MEGVIISPTFAIANKIINDENSSASIVSAT